MAITESHSGTEAVTSTEWSLTSDSSTLGAVADDGIYQLWIDRDDMIDTDELEIRVYEKARSGDAQQLLHMWKFRDAQSDPIWASPTLILLHGWEMTAKATAGTITVLWSIRKVA